MSAMNWRGDIVQIIEPGFDLNNLLEACTRKDTDTDDLLYDSILSCSPLTSLESSRCPSPTSSTGTKVFSPLTVLNGASDKLQQFQEEEREVNDSERPTKKPKTDTRNKKNKHQSKLNKKKKKVKNSQALFSVPSAAPSVFQRHVSRSQPLQTSNIIAEANVTQAAYVANKSEYERNTSYELDELVGASSRFQFRLEAWDGITPKPLVDSEGRVFAHLAGQPDDDTWKDNILKAAHLIETARGECSFSKQDHHQRPRGPFPILRCGVSHGGGQVQPCNVSHRDTRKNRKILQHLNRAPAFRRMSNFSSSVFASWAPELHKYYVDTAKAIHGKYPDLERPFPHSAFSATTYNMGPNTVCIPHTDQANLAYGWCAIFALGDYDPKQGGHLVLWDCKIVVEFPPGSLVLIPSAIIAHSNTPIQPHEKRYSFTQYTAGALFRWVDQEFKSQVEFRASKTKAELEEIDAKLKRRWQEGLAMLPRISVVS